MRHVCWDPSTWPPSAPADWLCGSFEDPQRLHSPCQRLSSHWQPQVLSPRAPRWLGSVA